MWRKTYFSYHWKNTFFHTLPLMIFFLLMWSRKKNLILISTSFFSVLYLFSQSTHTFGKKILMANLDNYSNKILYIFGKLIKSTIFLPICLKMVQSWAGFLPKFGDFLGLNCDFLPYTVILTFFGWQISKVKWWFSAEQHWHQCRFSMFLTSSRDKLENTHLAPLRAVRPFKKEKDGRGKTSPPKWNS